MSEPPYLSAIIKNEPKVPKIARESVIVVHSAGMRLAPEVLVLELFREVFFEQRYGTSRGPKELNPDDFNEERSHIYTDNERAVLYALRGRRKKTKSSKAKTFFAPAYPALARASWLGKHRERVVRHFLFRGPIAQHLWRRGPDSEEGKRLQGQIVADLTKALVGHNSCVGDEVQGKDILSVPLRQAGFQPDLELARRNLEEHTAYSNSIFGIHHDELSARIFSDVGFICGLEEQLPRMQWMQVLMTFLRFALPVWLLAQMRITSFLHSWLLQAMDDDIVADTEEIQRQIVTRNQRLLHPTLTPTREVFDHIEQYMKRRVETTILLYCLEEIRREEMEGKKLCIHGGAAEKLAIEELCRIARDSCKSLKEWDRFKQVAHGLDVRRFLTREGELFAAWRNPLVKGQGKNIDEFLRVMYRTHLGDEAGGYLLIPEGRGPNRGFRVFPGQLLLKTVTFLAARNKRASGGRAGGGKLVLEDVESHFQQYGIDFTSAADARPLLIQEMKAMGLLAGSPDAGSSVAVTCPY